MPPRPQAHRLTWPLTPSQVEGIDEMFQSLFKATRVATDVAVVARNSSGSLAVIGEIPTGLINGANAVFETATEYTGLRVYLNGVRQALTTDYTETSATTFTFDTAPTTGDLVTVDYGLTSVTGLRGPAGATGATGAAGTNGSDGADGDDGADGADGALVLLEQHTASASATLDFTTAISGTYDEYVIEMVGILPATDNVDLYLRMSTDGGSSYDTGSNYHWSTWLNSPTFSVGLGSASDTKITLAPNVDNGATGGVSGSLRLFLPASTSTYKQVSGQSGYLNNDGGRYNQVHGTWYKSTTAINAFRFVFSSGNIASGTVRVYGVAKT